MDLFGMGPLELLVILVVAVLVFGPEKLPEAAAGLGRAIRDFQRMSAQMTAEVKALTAEVEETKEAVVAAAGLDDLKQVVAAATSLDDIKQALAAATSLEPLAASPASSESSKAATDTSVTPESWTSQPAAAERTLEQLGGPVDLWVDIPATPAAPETETATAGVELAENADVATQTDTALAVESVEDADAVTTSVLPVAEAVTPAPSTNGRRSQFASRRRPRPVVAKEEEPSLAGLPKVGRDELSNAEPGGEQTQE